MGIATVEKLLPPGTKAFFLRDFLREYAPGISPLSGPSTGQEQHVRSATTHGNSCRQTELPEVLEKMIIAPLPTCRVVTCLPGTNSQKNIGIRNKTNPKKRPPSTCHQDCRESIRSLVDDVVYSLVQRRERLQRQNGNRRTHTHGGCDESDGRNALIRGFAVSREGDGPPPRGMRSGITYKHPNETVTFCKSSPVLKRLHRYVGDKVLRTILLHTRCFLPVLPESNGSDGIFSAGRKRKRNERNSTSKSIAANVCKEDDPSDDDKCNYILLCGPPLCNHTSRYNVAASNTDTNRRSPNQQQSDDGHDKNCTKRRKRKKRRCFPKAGSGHDCHANGSISRYSLMYCDSYSPHVALPKSHPFQQRLERQHQSKICSHPTKDNPNGPQRAHRLVKPDDGNNTHNEAYRFLLNVIFELHLENKNKQKRIRKRLSGNGRIVCDHLWKIHSSNSGRCFGQNHGRVLERYCSLPDAYRKVATSAPNNESLSKLAKAFSPKSGIVSFVGSVLRKAFPRAFWGSELNFQSVLATVDFFVRLRRNERLTNKRLMHGISVTDMKWLYPTNDDDVDDNATTNGTNHKSRKKRRCRHHINKQRTNHETATELTLKALRWVFKGFIIPLLRTSFYVTETEFSAKELQYYRKPVWSLVRALSLKKLTTSDGSNQRHFKNLSLSRARDNLLQQKMGLSRLRFLPKSSGMRPIAQLSKSIRFWFPNDSFQSCLSSSVLISRLPTNVILANVLDVLGYECDQRDKPFGCGIDNLGLFYNRYREYILDYQRRAESDGQMQLYFAKIDIEKCYDRINQEYLLRLVQDLVRHNTYVVQRVKMDSVNSRQKQGEETTDIRLRKLVETVENHQPFHHSEHTLAKTNRNTVFDLFQCKLAQRSTILGLLKEHLLRHTVITSGRYEKKVLLQSSGISQGSTLSMLLCNLYYGRVEEFLLASVMDDGDGKNGKEDLISRFVDDFLFISTNQASMQRFLDKTHKGKPELGARINPDKTLANIAASVQVTSPNGDTKHIPVSHSTRRNRYGNVLFPWCGLLFDTKSGEVLIDYERFRNGKLREGVTIDYDGKEGRKMEYRLRTFVAPRCLPILFDGSINSFETVVGNFYQIMLFAACKTVEYLRGSDPFVVVHQHNIEYFMRCIRSLPSFALWTVRCKSKIAFAKATDRVKAFDVLNQKLASVLCWSAFWDVFSYVSGLTIINCRLREESMSSFEFLSNQKKQEIKRVMSSAWDDFQIRHLIDK